MSTGGLDHHLSVAIWESLGIEIWKWNPNYLIFVSAKT
jgi:hypothetical protein